ncbi:hypothetical protein BCR44DRAFT_38086 [Catenaria anguillulae PL171]|uniref:Uncharacterized protein n=1 Tax=Catenaria anguillulae PL171 TaxID=765915 RepID=A0A1Y2I3L0_9FUNG|nr:hypothetical protein BCR44DRAFT_38086 [Catenaria anguillulae PL171]
MAGITKGWMVWYGEVNEAKEALGLGLPKLKRPARNTAQQFQWLLAGTACVAETRLPHASGLRGRPCGQSCRHRRECVVRCRGHRRPDKRVRMADMVGREVKIWTMEANQSNAESEEKGCVKVCRIHGQMIKQLKGNSTLTRPQDHRDRRQVVDSRRATSLGPPFHHEIGHACGHADVRLAIVHHSLRRRGGSICQCGLLL